MRRFTLGYGFPSGHVAAATAFSFGLVFVCGWRWAWWLLLAWVPLMAISRMYLGRHFLGDVMGGVAVGVIAASTALLGLTIARLENPATPRGAGAGRQRAPATARHILVTALVLAVVALWIRLPGSYDAGRFLGVGLAVFLIVRSNVPDEARWSVRLGRLALAAVLFPATAWVTSRLLEMMGITNEPVGALLAGALPTVMLLAGPIFLTAGNTKDLTVLRAVRG